LLMHSDVTAMKVRSLAPLFAGRGLG
jgi:hypothetical protein